jgi:hypothetical protein
VLPRGGNRAGPHLRGSWRTQASARPITATLVQLSIPLGHLVTGSSDIGRNFYVISVQFYQNLTKVQCFQTMWDSPNFFSLQGFSWLPWTHPHCQRLLPQAGSSFYLFIYLLIHSFNKHSLTTCQACCVALGTQTGMVVHV